jgi:hydroxyethylthiazole kinase-like uncharacterized protein yjeF
LAGVAALRVGAGVLALAAPDPVAIPLAVAVPEASVWEYDAADCWSGDKLAALVNDADAVLVGPGIDNPQTATNMLSGLLDHLDPSGALALDAFALGVLRDAMSAPALQAQPLVMSPNSDEALRLLDADELDQDETTVALTIAQRWHSVVTYQSTIADSDGTVWHVGAGHAGLGTSGSGDVLAGAITGLLARGADTNQAAVWGTYLHAAAGDRLAARVGQLGFLAREVVDQLPIVMAELQA